MGRKGRVSLSVGWATLFLMGTDLFVISPPLPFISEEYHIRSAAAGSMVTLFAVTYAFSAPFFGWLSDKQGRRLLITLGLLLFAVSNLLTALAPSFSWLIVSRILAGFSVASITPLIYAIIGDIAPPLRRGVWLSVVVSGHLTALWAEAPIGTLIEHLLDWRLVFVVMAVVGVILAIINLQVWRDLPTSNSSGHLFGGNLLRILKSVSVTGIWAISMYALYIYLGRHSIRKINFSSSQIAFAVTFNGIGAVLGSLASGQLTNKFGERRVSKLSMISLTAILIALGMVFPRVNWSTVSCFYGRLSAMQALHHTRHASRLNTPGKGDSLWLGIIPLCTLVSHLAP